MKRILPLIGIAACFAGCGGGELELSGAELYTYHCSACHGPQAQGDGPVAEVMSISVPDLRSLSARNGGVFPAEAVARFIDGRDLPAAHGDRYMPVWGDVFSWPEDFQSDENAAPDERRVEVRINAIVEFLEQIQYPK